MYGEIAEVVVFSPNQGCAVACYCWKCTVGYGTGHGSCPGRRPDLAEIAQTSLWLLWASWWSLWRVPSSMRGVAAFRGSYRTGSCPGQGRSRFRGSCPCRSRAPRKGKYEGGMGSWQYSSWSSAEHVLNCVAGSHSVVTASRMAEQ